MTQISTKLIRTADYEKGVNWTGYPCMKIVFNSICAALLLCKRKISHCGKMLVCYLCIGSEECGWGDTDWTLGEAEVRGIIDWQFSLVYGQVFTFLRAKSECCCSAAQSCETLCSPMDCSTPGFPVLHCLPELAQIHVHWVSDAIQPSHPLPSPSRPAFNLSQHQGLL